MRAYLNSKTERALLFASVLDFDVVIRKTRRKIVILRPEFRAITRWSLI